MSGKRRLFFALWPDDGVRRLIREAPFPRLKPRTTPMENWHMTLVFLGPTSLEQQQVCEQVADTIDAAPFEVCLDYTGKFIRARVAWLGCSRPHPALVQLQADLEAGLRRACPEHSAFAEQPRPYCPHVTLYRKVGKPLVPEKIKPVRWAVDSFSLIESRPAERPVYRVLNSWQLGHRQGIG